MKTRMEPTSLGESKANYTNSSVRHADQRDYAASPASHASSPSPAQLSSTMPTPRTQATSSPSHTTPYNTYQAGMANRSSSGNGKLAVGLLAGAGVGMLAGMLLAPERGRDMRKQLANSAARVGDQMNKAMDMCKSTMNSWTGKTNSWTSSGKDGASTTHNELNKNAPLESNAGPDAIDKHIL